MREQPPTFYILSNASVKSSTVTYKGPAFFPSNSEIFKKKITWLQRILHFNPFCGALLIWCYVQSRTLLMGQDTVRAPFSKSPRHLFSFYSPKGMNWVPSFNSAPSQLSVRVRCSLSNSLLPLWPFLYPLGCEREGEGDTHTHSVSSITPAKVQH